jgi:hypothetical protein
MSQQYGFRASNNLSEAENNNSCLDNLGINRNDLPLLENTSASGVTEADYQSIIGLSSNLESQIIALSAFSLSGLTTLSTKATATGDTFTGNLLTDRVNNDRPFTPLDGSIIGPSTISYFSPAASGVFSSGGEYKLGPITASTVTTSGVNYTGAVQEWNPRFERYKSFLRIQEQPSWTVRYSPLYLPPPTAISGCQIWLDAEYSSFDLDASNGVIGWRSLAGGLFASQATVANRPIYTANVINSKPAIRFDGSNDLLSLGNIGSLFPSAATMVCIVRVLDADYNIFSTLNNSGCRWNGGAGTGSLGVFTTAIQSTFPASSMPLNGTWVMSVRISTAYGLEVRLNGVRIDYKATGFTYAGGDTFLIGAAPGSQGFLNGDIHSLALYNRVLTDRELRTIEECFAWRYDGVYNPDRIQVLQLEDFTPIELEDSVGGNNPLEA